MMFGISKCAILVLKREKKVEEGGIQMPGGIAIGDLGDGDYKYPGVLKPDKNKMEEMKLKVRQDYYRGVRKVLELNLNGGNTVKDINSWAFAAVRYSTGIVDWTADKLKTMNRKTRKLMTMNGALHSWTDVDRQYVTRGEGGRGRCQWRMW